VVALSIITVSLFELTRFKVMVTGVIPAGLPLPAMPTIRLRDQEGIVALATGCMLLAYIEGVAAARAFATKHHQTIDPRRELLGLAAANIATAAGGGYPVAGGLSQTAVNEGAGARSRVSLVFASLTLALCLLFFTTLLANLPKAMLASVVLMAVSGLVDLRAFARMWRASRVDFLNALAALVGVLLLGILEGILLAALISVLLLIALSSPGPEQCASGGRSRRRYRPASGPRALLSLCGGRVGHVPQRPIYRARHQGDRRLHVRALADRARVRDADRSLARPLGRTVGANDSCHQGVGAGPGGRSAFLLGAAHRTCHRRRADWSSCCPRRNSARARGPRSRPDGIGGPSRVRFVPWERPTTLAPFRA
jgi:hypothetical protein